MKIRCFFFTVLCYPSDFYFLVSTTVDIYIPITVILVLLFNNILFLTVKLIFSLYVCFFT